MPEIQPQAVAEFARTPDVGDFDDGETQWQQEQERRHSEQAKAVGEQKYQFNSLEEVLAAHAPKDKDWSVSFSSQNEGAMAGYLKSETHEWIYKDTKGEKKSLTNSINGKEEKERHTKILEDLYSQGWSVVEYWHPETQKIIREIYFSDNKGKISFQTYDLRAEIVFENLNEDGDGSISENEPLSTSLSLITTPGITFDLNSFFTGKPKQQIEAKAEASAWDEFWDDLFKQQPKEFPAGKEKNPLSIFGFEKPKAQNPELKPAAKRLNKMAPAKTLPEFKTADELDARLELNQDLVTDSETSIIIQTSPARTAEPTAAKLEVAKLTESSDKVPDVGIYIAIAKKTPTLPVLAEPAQTAAIEQTNTISDQLDLAAKETLVIDPETLPTESKTEQTTDQAVESPAIHIIEGGQKPLLKLKTPSLPQREVLTVSKEPILDKKTVTAEREDKIPDTELPGVETVESLQGPELVVFKKANERLVTTQSPETKNAANLNPRQEMEQAAKIIPGILSTNNSRQAANKIIPAIQITSKLPGHEAGTPGQASEKSGYAENDRQPEAAEKIFAPQTNERVVILKPAAKKQVAPKTTVKHIIKHTGTLQRFSITPEKGQSEHAAALATQKGERENAASPHTLSERVVKPATLNRIPALKPAIVRTKSAADMTFQKTAKKKPLKRQQQVGRLQKSGDITKNQEEQAGLPLPITIKKETRISQNNKAYPAPLLYQKFSAAEQGRQYRDLDEIQPHRGENTIYLNPRADNERAKNQDWISITKDGKSPQIRQSRPASSRQTSRQALSFWSTGEKLKLFKPAVRMRDDQNDQNETAEQQAISIKIAA